MKKRAKIIIIVAIVLIILAIVGFYFLNKSLSLGLFGFDFSSGTNALGGIGNAVNANTFENTKLNPFENSTG